MIAPVTDRVLMAIVRIGIGIGMGEEVKRWLRRLGRLLASHASSLPGHPFMASSERCVRLST